MEYNNDNINNINVLDHKVRKYLNKLVELYQNNLNINDIEKYNIYLTKFRYYNNLYGGKTDKLTDTEIQNMKDKDIKKLGNDFNEEKFKQKIDDIQKLREDSKKRNDAPKTSE